jgi:hypothetical protein
VTKSSSEVASMFDSFTWPDFHWNHWDGYDRKLFFNSRWYHITVGYGYHLDIPIERIGRWRDDSLRPQWIKIQCDSHEPGSSDHLFKDHFGWK